LCLSYPDPAFKCRHCQNGMNPFLLWVANIIDNTLYSNTNNGVFFSTCRVEKKHHTKKINLYQNVCQLIPFNGL
jgi:hypothetical protein